MKYGRITIVLILFLAVRIFAQSDAVQVHGFISQGYMQSTENDFLGHTHEGTFEFNEFGINFSTELTDELRVGMQFFARDLGLLGNGELLVDWAYGDYKWKNWLGIRAGKIKMPLGLYNEYRDLDLARTNIFMPQGVYNETWRSTFNAIKGIDMDIKPNTVTAFIGPSGCGKSTFLRLFNRMNDYIEGFRMEGKIKINGNNIY